LTTPKIRVTLSQNRGLATLLFPDLDARHQGLEGPEHLIHISNS